MERGMGGGGRGGVRESSSRYWRLRNWLPVMMMMMTGARPGMMEPDDVAVDVVWWGRRREQGEMMVTALTRLYWWCWTLCEPDTQAQA